MADRTKILDKIKKCLALSTSANEHEAAAALRQAKKLMEAHGITDLDVQAAEAEERRAKAGAKSKPACWETVLALKVGDAFGCRVIFFSHYTKGEWCFIGCGVATEVAQYTFVVLHRQAKRAREEYITANLKRCKVATKTRRADLFSEGWVMSVVDTITAFAGNEKQTNAIDAYQARHYPSLLELQSRNRNDGRKLRGHEYDDYFAGGDSGRSAQLNRGVGGQSTQLFLE